MIVSRSHIIHSGSTLYEKCELYQVSLCLDLPGRNPAWQWPMALAIVTEMLDGFSQFLQEKAG